MLVCFQFGFILMAFIFAVFVILECSQLNLDPKQIVITNSIIYKHFHGIGGVKKMLLV